MKKIDYLLAAGLALYICFYVQTASVRAAAGDRLFACDFEGAGGVTQVMSGCGFGYLDQTTGAIAAEGWNGGKCYKGYYPANTADLYEAKFWTSAGNKREITIVYYERFSIPNSAGYGWNFKGVRAKNGDSDYIGGTVSQWSRDGGDSWFLQGHLGSAVLEATAAVSRVNTYAGYCASAGGNKYNCGNQMAVEFAPALAWGTNWRKVRLYLKAPSSVTARDGESKLWIDDTLVYTLTNIAGNSAMLPYFTYVDFRPSDDFFTNTPKPALYHYYDDIAIYEGLVPPSGPISQYCGDKSCNSNETCSSCPGDCGICPTTQKGDFNTDNKVDVTDLGILLSNWGSTAKPAADLNQDGKVDVTDLGILLGNWG